LRRLHQLGVHGDNAQRNGAARKLREGRRVMV
jgi:hypothetical protein